MLHTTWSPQKDITRALKRWQRTHACWVNLAGWWQHSTEALPFISVGSRFVPFCSPQQTNAESTPYFPRDPPLNLNIHTSWNRNSTHPYNAPIWQGQSLESKILLPFQVSGSTSSMAKSTLKNGFHQFNAPRKITVLKPFSVLLYYFLYFVYKFNVIMSYLI